MLSQVVYISCATNPLGEAELAQMLREARERNQKNEITGLLLYRNGDFMQVIEGPHKSVRELLEKILRDPRHARVRILREGPLAERQFADWTMGFKTVPDSAVRQLSGYSRFLEEPLAGEFFAEHPDHALQFLQMMRDTG